ncbi:hypothetical protein PHET_01374 [Paragonimus heterotremus]|uniref:Uncharacterized protein n=1 Tax=Paragonimus heterotremus TaxID=100268 RepID=A0A8J4WL92_9TREM|nr:hypothetical protein PHET_01374 [Paragonimus heterotremus]
MVYVTAGDHSSRRLVDVVRLNSRLTALLAARTTSVVAVGKAVVNPTWLKICTNCIKANHFPVCCKSGPSLAKTTQSRRYSVCAVGMNEPQQGIRSAEIDLNGITINFQLHSCAVVNLVPLSWVPNEKLVNTNLELRMWNGTTVRPTWKFTAILRNPNNDKRVEQVLFVVNKNFPSLLGVGAIEVLELVTFNCVHNVISPMTNMCLKYCSFFKDRRFNHAGVDLRDSQARHLRVNFTSSPTVGVNSLLLKRQNLLISASSEKVETHANGLGEQYANITLDIAVAT